MTQKLARASGRHPWFVLSLWLLVLLGAFVLVATFLEFEGDRTSHPWTWDFLWSWVYTIAGGTSEIQREITADRVLEAAPTRARVAALADELRAAGASRVITYGEEPRLVSQDRDSTVLLVGLGSDGEGDV